MPKIPDLGQLKKALIRLIEQLDGLPEDRRTNLTQALSHKDTRIPDKHTAKEVSLFIALVFCTGKIPHLNARNKLLLEKFTTENLTPLKDQTSPSHSRKK